MHTRVGFFIMAIRLANMTLWQRDWFLGLEGRYQHFVSYLRDHCDCAGVWQPSFILFEKISGFRVKQEEFLSSVNKEQVRVLVLDNGRWWLTGFIEDQCKTLNLSDHINPHKGVINSIRFNNIPYKSYGYTLTLQKGTGGVKDKDQDKDQSSCISTEEGMQGDKPTWRISLPVYTAECDAAYNMLIADDEWIAGRQRFHSSLNIKMSLEKAWSDYWRTATGWNHKRKSRSEEIDWRATFANALTMKCNQVWLSKQEIEDKKYEGKPTFDELKAKYGVK